MAGPNPDLVVRVAANISALQADMASAAASVKNIEGAVVTANAASTSWAGSLNDLGHSWVLRIAEGQLLRDAVREVIAVMKEMAAFLPEIAMKGAVFGDIEEAFHRLTGQAGLLSDALLTTLRGATHGTIDDLDLMKRVNQDLAAGLNLTDGQFGLLAQGAFALAKATGTDVKTAFDTMNDAMLTGRTRSLAMLTGKIDLKDAEEKYALSLGSTVDHLTAEGKIEAARVAILAGVGGAVERLGEQTDSLDEKVRQGEVAWANFQLELGKAIAQSPVINAAFDSVKASLAAAFGPDQKTQIAAIAAIVDQLAIKVVEFGIGAGLVAGEMVQAWNLIKVPILAVETLIVGLVTAVGEVLLAAEKLAGKLHLVDPDEVRRIQETQVGLRAMTVSLAEQTAEAARGALGQSALNQTIDKGVGALVTMRDNMIAAAAAHKDGASAAAAFVGPLEQINAGIGKQGMLVSATAAELKAWDDLLAKMDKETFALAMEHEKQWRGEQAARTKIATDAVVAEFEAHVKLNAEWGLNAAGAIEVQKTSLDRLNLALAALEQKRLTALAQGVVLVSQDAQKQVLIDAYTKALYDDAVAQDGQTAAIERTIVATAKATEGFHALEMASKAATIAGAPESTQQALIDQGYSGTTGFRTAGEIARNYTPDATTILQRSQHGMRAEGGPVTAGLPYEVGERGRELFVPETNGSIVPNGGGGWGGGPTTINVMLDGRVVASVVQDHQTKSLKQIRQLPAW